MSKFNDMIQDFHDSSEKWDPITHQHLDDTQKWSTKSVEETARMFGSDHWVGMAEKDSKDFGRWGGNTIKGAAAVYAGMSAYSSMGSGTGTTGTEGTYFEQGGGVVSDNGSGGFQWTNADGTGGNTGSYGEGGNSPMPNFTSQMGQGGGNQEETQESQVETDDENFYQGNRYYAQSSSKVKRPVRARMGDVAMRRGAANDDVIDSNGVQMAAIQQLSKQLVVAQKRLATLKAAA